MKRASHYKDTDQLIEIFKTLPIIPQRESKWEWKFVSHIFINIEKIYWSAPEANERLKERKLEIQRDWAFWLTNKDFLFTKLIQM